MKPWQKITLALVSGLAFFTVLSAFIVISFLPEPSAIGKRLRPKPALVPETSVTTQPAPAASGIAASQGAKVDPAKTLVQAAAERKRLVNEKFIDKFLRDDRIQSRVCENLDGSPAPFKSGDEFGKQIESSLLGESKPSATVEAVMLPIEYTLKNEAVRDLIRSAENAAARGETGFLNKAQFYAQAARATTSLLNSREELESISGNAYRLYAIGRAAALKPEILQDPDLGDLCRGIESAAIDHVNRDEAFDRDRLSKLLQRHAIAPDSIGYDPNLSTRISINTTDGIRVETPWIQKVLTK